MISYRCMYVHCGMHARICLPASCIERNKSSKGNNSNENSNEISNKNKKPPSQSQETCLKILCELLLSLLLLIFFPRIVLCAILLYLSIVVVVVQFGFFIRIYIADIFGISIHTLLLFRCQLPSLCRSLTPHSPIATALLGSPLSFSLSLTSHRYDMLSYTYTCCCLSHARECYLFTTHSVRQRALFLSLSCPLLFTLSAFAHILNCFATCGKSTSRLVAHFAFDSTVAISALSSPTPNICICLHLCVCDCAYSDAVLRGRAALVACRLQHVRFPVYFLSIAAASTRRQPPTARRASLLRSRLASFDPHSFLVICSGSRKKTREKLIRI